MYERIRFLSGRRRTYTPAASGGSFMKEADTALDRPRSPRRTTTRSQSNTRTFIQSTVMIRETHTVMRRQKGYDLSIMIGPPSTKRSVSSLV